MKPLARGVYLAPGWNVSIVPPKQARAQGATCQPFNRWFRPAGMHPADATAKPGDPLQIETKGTDGDIWVAMLVGSSRPPTVNVTGNGLGSSLDLGKARVRFGGPSDRILVEK